jgi:hypothetical protein
VFKLAAAIKVGEEYMSSIEANNTLKECKLEVWELANSIGVN